MAVEVGARRVTELILDTLRIPLRLSMRGWGYCLTLLVALLGSLDTLGASSHALTAWCVAYTTYNLVLELARWKVVRSYDSSWFQTTRVLINVVAATWLLAICPGARGTLWIGYLIPIGAALLYFPQTPSAAVTLIASVLGLYVGGVALAVPPGYDPAELLVIAVSLVMMSAVVWLLLERWIEPSPLGDVATRFHKTIDLDELAREIVQAAASLTHSDRALLLVIDPRTGRYVHHAMLGFTFRSGRSVEELCARCEVIRTGKPFDCHDLITVFEPESLYARFFECRPRSVIAVPIFDKAGRVMGVLNVTHDQANRFIAMTRRLVENLSFEAAAAIENAVSFRLAQLREARHDQIGVGFAHARDETEILELLMVEAGELILQAHEVGVILYSYDRKTQSALALQWSAGTSDSVRRVLADAAAACGRSREPSLIRDTTVRSWNAKGDHINVGAVAIAPINERLHHEPTGVIVVYSSRPGVFNAQTETKLASLCHQAAAALALVRLRQHESLMRRILHEVQKFDERCDEDELCHQVVEAAMKLLPFSEATLSLLTAHSRELVVRAALAVDRRGGSVVGSRMSAEALKLLLTQMNPADGTCIIGSNESAWRLLSRFRIGDTGGDSDGRPIAQIVAVPLNVEGDQFIGLLTLSRPATALPTPEVVDAAGVLGRAAAWILVRARDRRQLEKQRTRMQTFIRAISKDLAQCRSLEAVGNVVVQAGAQFLNAEGCTLYLVDEHTITLAYSNYLAGTEYIGLQKPIGMRPGAGFAAWVATSGRTLKFSNREHEHHPAFAGDIDHHRYLPSKHCESVLVAPVRSSRGAIVAVLAFVNKHSTHGREPFEAEDVTRVEDLARQYALTIEALDKREGAANKARETLKDDLHELSGLVHAGISLPLQVMAHHFDNGNRDRAMQLLGEVVPRAQTAVRELRTLLSTVNSGFLEDDNFPRALDRMVQAWRVRFHGKPVEVTVECPPSFEAPQAVRNTILRISQSALANALQHSGVADDPNGSIKVIVRSAPHCVSLCVEDSGCGLNGTPPGFGRTRMRQLVDMLNQELKTDATFMEESEPGRGTRVRVEIPLLWAVRS